MNPIESYLNELIVNIDNVKDLDKDDLINILYLIYNNKENTSPIIYNMIEIILFKFFLYLEENEKNNLINIYNQIKKE